MLDKISIQKPTLDGKSQIKALRTNAIDSGSGQWLGAG